MLEVEEEVNLVPLNLGMIAAYYYVQYATVELFASSVTAKTKVKGLLEILASASEYGELAIRQGEERVLAALATRLPQKLPEGARFSETHVKALVLLQAHFSRAALPTELRADQRMVVGEAPRMLQALVDVVSSECWLKPCIAAMELCQMVVQGLWDKDSYLLQIPHFTPEIVARCEAHGEEGVESPLGILELDDDVRDQLLQLPPAKMADVARFCNAYPNIDMEFEVQGAGGDAGGEVVAGKPVSVVVTPGAGGGRRGGGGRGSSSSCSRRRRAAGGGAALPQAQAGVVVADRRGPGAELAPLHQARQQRRAPHPHQAQLRGAGGGGRLQPQAVPHLGLLHGRGPGVRVAAHVPAGGRERGGGGERERGGGDGCR